MKRILTLLLILSLFLVACNQQPPADTPNDEQPDDGANDELEPEDDSTDEVEESDNDGPSALEMLGLKAAMATGIPYKCTWRMENERGGSREATIVVKGEDFYSVGPGISKDGTAHGIKDGDMFYMWNEPENEGFMFDMSQIPESMSGQMEEYEYKSSAEDYETPGVSIDCSPTTSIDLTPPSDVEFQDMSDLFEQLEAMQAGGDFEMPEGYDY